MRRAPRELKVELGIIKPTEVADGIAKLNEKHAVVMLGGKCVVLNEVEDPVFHRPDITFSSPTDFKTKYANKKVKVENSNGEQKSHCIANVWMEDGRRREYEGIVFSPGQSVPKYYNLYRGLAVTPKKGDWSLLKSHLEQNICGGVAVYSEYLLDWMADAVQNPGGLRSGVSVVLRGGRGTGKGLFATSFGKIFGSHFLHLRDQNHLVGRFNSHHKDALVLFADECFWAGNKTSEGLLKALITEETIQIEAKGKDPITVQNHIRLIVASNDDWVIPAGLDERRFFCLDVRESHKQDISYWNPIWEETRRGGISAMLHDLMERQYDPIALRTPPRTWALVAQIEHSMTSVQRWWYECLSEGSLTRHDLLWDDKVSTEKLHTDYLEHCEKCNERYPESRAIFGKSLRRICNVLPVRLPPEVYGGRRSMGFKIPELDDCRAQFDVLIGVKLNWELSG